MSEIFDNDGMIDSVWNVCNLFVGEGISTHVTLNESAIKTIANNIEHELSNKKDYWWGYPKSFEKINNDVPYKILYYELLASAVNYQYWYGKHDIRPNGACANKMYKILDDSVTFIVDEVDPTSGQDFAEDITKMFILNLSLARLPNTENRIKHIKEVSALVQEHGMDTIRHLSDKVSQNDMGIEEFLNIIVSKLPGFADDLFLKRAFLLPIMLYRRLQWFKDDIHTVPVPADYQIPKVLEDLGCISYSYLLSEKIQAGELLPAGSLEECELRAATVITCAKLAEFSGCKMCDIDTFLWLKSKEIDRPFHLTMTTNY
jgi:hypothetical protein